MEMLLDQKRRTQGTKVLKEVGETRIRYKPKCIEDSV